MHFTATSRTRGDQARQRGDVAPPFRKPLGKASVCFASIVDVLARQHTEEVLSLCAMLAGRGQGRSRSWTPAEPQRFQNRTRGGGVRHRPESVAVEPLGDR